MPQFRYGLYDITFSGTFSGNAPTEIKGPDRSLYTVEHQIPAREGGIVEYLGSQQPTYQIRGFIAPSMDGPFNGVAAQTLSGTGYVQVNSDDALKTLSTVGGSGAQLLRIESTDSNASGYQKLYENSFFFLRKFTFAIEAGHAYPYYPYTLDLVGASSATYGNNSGTATWPFSSGRYFSGYVRYWVMYGGSGMTNGETFNTLGINVRTVSSGSLMLAIYSGTAIPTSNGLIVTTAPQPVHSGWNYFPISPSFVSKSGIGYILAFMGTAANASGFTVSMFDNGDTLTAAFQSGVTFGAFPATIGSSATVVSGLIPDIVMVAA